MIFKICILLAFFMQFSFAQQAETKSQTTDQGLLDGMVDEFLAGKKTQTWVWYTGIVTGGAGIVSLVLASHFDGLAAVKRNEAAQLFENRASNSEYVAKRESMIKRENWRNISFVIGSTLGLIGSSLMIYDWNVNQNVSVTLQPNAIGVAWNL